MYPYGLIGNCQISALVSQIGSVDWLCLPRPDGPPVFGKILDDEGGFFTVNSANSSESSVGHQYYIPNTNILVTEVVSNDGGRFKITDFCPRFMQHGRMYRPICLFRKVECLEGTPQIKVSCRPINGWDKRPVRPIRGNSHVRYEIRGDYLRVATNMPLTYFLEEIPFILQEPIYFGLTWSHGMEEDLPKFYQHCLEETHLYWQTWVKHCSIPVLCQKETIRSALTLKLHCYEDTGAILAALTTSLPEEVGGIRNWDYRYCWLRDAYYSLSAFHQLGHFEEMEGFLKFLLNIAHGLDGGVGKRLRPVYSLDRKLPLPEEIHANWSGYRKSPPVRTLNQAAEHVQNDVYGEMILSLAPIFFDERFHHLRTKDHEELMEKLVVLSVQNISKPDAGLWELRDGWQEHSFSNLMCWAGIERAQRIRQQGYLKFLKIDLEAAKKLAENSLRAAVIDGSLRNGPKDKHFDASLLQLPILRFPDKDVCEKTVMRITEQLRCGEGRDSSYLYRYIKKDDFGSPQSAFVICSFWLVQALARIGKMETAAKVMSDIVKSSNHLGLFSEHYIPKLKQQCGNFPQAYSHVGLINAAFALGPPWDQIL